MSFSAEAVQGDAAEIKTKLEGLPQHEREENLIPVISKAVDTIVEAMGGYLSLSVNGNLNPAAGETGDLVNIYIVSLPAPQSAPAETPVTQEGLETTPVAEIPVTETPAEVAPESPVVVTPQENPVIPVETPAPIPPAEQPIAVENPPVVEAPVVTPESQQTPAAGEAPGGVGNSTESTPGIG